MTPTKLSLYPSKPSLYRYCTLIVPLLYPHCTPTVLYLHCTLLVPWLYPYCTFTVPYCTLSIPLLYPHCTPTVSWLYPNCTLALPHCTNSTLTVPTLYQRCPYILVMVLPHTLPKWSLLWRGGGGAFSAKANSSDSFRILTGNNGHFKTFQLSVLIKLTDITSFNRCDMVFGCIRQIYKNVK